MENRIKELKKDILEAEGYLKDIDIIADVEANILNEVLNNYKRELYLLETQPRKRISTNSKDESALSEVVDKLGAIKENLETLVGGDFGNELAWETLELMFEFKNYFTLSEVDIPSTPDTLNKNIDEVLFDYKGLVYGHWVESEEGDSGILTKRLDDLNN